MGNKIPEFMLLELILVIDEPEPCKVLVLVPIDAAVTALAVMLPLIVMLPVLVIFPTADIFAPNEPNPLATILLPEEMPLVETIVPFAVMLALLIQPVTVKLPAVIEASPVTAKPIKLLVNCRPG
jgi:hypothetical protein